MQGRAKCLNLVPFLYYYGQKNWGFESDREGEVNPGSVCNIDLEIDYKGTDNREEARGTGR